MENHPSPADNPQNLDLEGLRAERAKFQDARLAPLTLQGYRYDAGMFQAWCEAAGLMALPATTETVSLYLVSLLQNGKKITTAWRRVFAITHMHRAAGLGSPVNQEIYDLLNCAQRMLREKPRQMRPLTIVQLRAMSSELRRQGTMAAVRNRAVLVLAYATALRRSSIAALEVADIEFSDAGLVITVRAEKQDPEGRGRLIGVPPGKHSDTDAIACLNDWLELRGRNPGPLFWRLTASRKGEPLDGDCVYRLVKQCLRMIGLSERYAPHSTRAGLITEAAEAGVQPWVIAAQSGHRSMEVLRRYFRRTELFKANVCYALDL